MRVDGRDIVLKALVGSHNYGLANEESDLDYKVFVTPTFEELYTGGRYSKSIITSTEDNDIHDVRKLTDLLFKANINFLEVLASNDLYIPTGNTEMHSIVKFKKEIFKMNLPHLFNACKGLYYNKMKDLSRGTEGTQHLMEKYGYDTKMATHAMRVLRTAVKFESTDFNDFDSSIRYYDDELELMLDIRHGRHSKDEFEKLVENYLESTFLPLADKYGSYKPNFELKDELENIVMKLIKRKLLTSV